MKRFFATILKAVSTFLDFIKFGETADFAFRLVKLNTRELTPVEKQEAQKVFADSLNYDRIYIDERSLISTIGAFFQGGGGMGVTLFHTVNFNQKIAAAPGNGHMAWLIHELTHVCQYELVGTRYIGEALNAQATGGYDYGGGSALAGKNLADFNREQQGDIIKDYYTYVIHGSSPYAEEYKRMQQQLIEGKI